MAVFHFEGSSDSGFQVSGMLEADDASKAKRKAQRFCGTRELVQVFPVDPQHQMPHVGGEVQSGLAVNESVWKAWAARLAALLAGSWLRGSAAGKKEPDGEHHTMTS